MSTDDSYAPERHPGFLSTELANSLTHGLGCLLSIAGVAWLVARAGRVGDPRLVIACSVYGATLIALYLASTLYHTARFGTRARRIFRIVDHSAIYLLIAGTYTPFTLVSLAGPWGWSLFGVEWGLAALGIVFKLFFTGRWEVFRHLLYLAMGWMAIVAVQPLLESVSMGGLAWMFAGGLCYTLGIVFYLWKSIPHHHAIWHVFVMAGSLCHFFSIMFFVVPTPLG